MTSTASNRESDSDTSDEFDDFTRDEIEDVAFNDGSTKRDDSADRNNNKSTNSSFVDDRQAGFTTFFCDEPGCIKRFFRFQNLVNHHARGDHLFKPDKLKIRDRVIQLFKSGIEQVKPHQTILTHGFKVISNASRDHFDEQSTSSSSEQSMDEEENENIPYDLQQGWALLELNSNTRFSSEQIDYLNEKYEEGQNNGSKWDASAVFEVNYLDPFIHTHGLLIVGDAKQRRRQW